MLYHKKYFLGNNKDWVILIHGAGGSSSIWFRQIKAYKRHFNVLIMDLRGHGKSRHLIQKYYKEKYSFKSVSHDILEVMDHLKIKKAHFVGVSLGTIIIRTLADMQPERVKSSVMCGAITRMNVRSRFLVWLGHMFKRIVPFMWLYRLFAWVIMPKSNHAESRLLFISEAKKLAQKEFLKWYKLTYEVNPILRYFKEKEMLSPTLYVMGSEDHMFLPPVKEMVKNFKQTTLAVIDNCGHVCNVQEPKAFNRISIQFMKGIENRA